MKVKVVWSDRLNAYTIKVKRMLFWKTVCVPVDEFDVKPLTFDDVNDAVVRSKKIANFGKYILR